MVLKNTRKIGLARNAIGRIVRNEILMAFGRQSENATCLAAAGPLDMDPDTVRRYLRLEVQKPDAAIIMVCRAYRGAKSLGVLAEMILGAA